MSILYRSGRFQSIRSSSCLDCSYLLAFPADNMSPCTRAHTTQPRRILVIGTTGCGKTTFINLVSGADLSIGHGLSSCTREICEVSFSLSTHDVIIIDTPGFDDTEKPQVAILIQLAKYLKKMREDHKNIVGIIYLHRISDIRMSGAVLRDLHLFKGVCGTEAMKNIAIVTNMWTEGNNEKEAERESELRNKFFKDFLANGARMFRHDNTVASAREIVQSLLSRQPSDGYAHTQPNPHRRALVREPRYILLVGPTGCGKTAFTNLMSQSHFDIGRGVQPCTETVQSGRLTLSDQEVVLIDTPGFDNLKLSQSQVIEIIKKHVQTLRDEGKPVCGAVYFHRISDRRIGRTAIENIRSFQVLCKDEKIDNTMVATTMWSEVNDATVGAQREEQLQGKFGPGARLFRHNNGASSAEAIVRELLFNAPLVLQIQRELIELRRTIPETAAGRELENLLSGLEEENRKELQRIRDEMKIQTAELLADLKKSFEQEISELKDRLEKLQAEKAELQSAGNARNATARAINGLKAALPV